MSTSSGSTCFILKGKNKNEDVESERQTIGKNNGIIFSHNPIYDPCDEAKHKYA